MRRIREVSDGFGGLDVLNATLASCGVHVFDGVGIGNLLGDALVLLDTLVQESAQVIVGSPRSLQDPRPKNNQS